MADSFSLAAANVAGGDDGDFTSLKLFADADNDGEADSNAEISASTTLAAEGVYRFIVQAVVPAGAAGNAAYKVTVTATSVGDNTKSDSDSATATVGALYAVDLSDAPDQNTTAGATVTFRYTVTNTGNLADSFSLAAANVAGGDDGDFTSLKLFADADNDGAADNNTEISASTTLAAEGVYRFIVQAVGAGRRSGECRLQSDGDGHQRRGQRQDRHRQRRRRRSGRSTRWTSPMRPTRTPLPARRSRSATPSPTPATWPTVSAWRRPMWPAGMTGTSRA